MDLDVVYSMGAVSKNMSKMRRYVCQDRSILGHALKETKGGWKTAHLVPHCHRPENYMNLLSDNLWWFYGDAKVYFPRALILSRHGIRFQSTAAMANAFWTRFVVLECMFNLHALTKSTGSEQLQRSFAVSGSQLFESSGCP